MLGGGGASPALPSSVPASHVLGQIGAALKRQAPLLLVAISVVLLPIAYVPFEYGSDSLSELDSTHLWHIAMQTGANLACAVIALHLRGRLRR